eukprot:GSChrysophyteH1.ASY1.ANO1.2384.1 assembled CDS
MSTSNRRLTKNEKRRIREKEAAKKAKDDAAVAEAAIAAEMVKNMSKKQKRASRFVEQDVEVNYVSADFNELSKGANEINGEQLDAFQTIFSKFARPEELTATSGRDIIIDVDDNLAMDSDDDNDMDIAESGAVETLSKRKLRLLQRPTIAQLKQFVDRPEVVEAHDVTAPDPCFLVTLKSNRNTVPVPSHWAQRKKYLSGKRGVEKPPFQLPAFIADTGIDRIRQSLIEAEAGKRAKAKARAQVRPSMGKVDIDYQVLHDAFFKYQTKPQLSRHGELYYEGKEAEMINRNKKPGESLSEGLLAALGIKLEDAKKTPPPWLAAQQRFGPPPSYPSLKIPGLSAPIPRGCQFGYGPGGWGHPPVDEYGRALYGDVFGTGIGINEGEEIVDVGTLWGEVIPVDSESDDEIDLNTDASGDEEEDKPESMERIVVPAVGSEDAKLPGLGIGATLSAQEIERLAEQTIDLRKQNDETSVSTNTGSATLTKDPSQLFTEVQVRSVESTQQGELFSSDKTYMLENSKEDTQPASGERESKAKRRHVPAKSSELDNFKF